MLRAESVLLRTEAELEMHQDWTMVELDYDWMVVDV